MLIETCRMLGFEGKNLIAMQGPFSKELNAAMLRQYDCRYLVTKDSGKAGGFEEKIQAATECGAIPVIIGRPVQEKGISVKECKRMLPEKFGFQPTPHVVLLGIGMGSKETLTIQGNEAVEQAKKRGIREIYGHYYPTAKNKMVAGLYESFGFEKISQDEEGNTAWRLLVEGYEDKNTVIKVKEEHYA